MGDFRTPSFTEAVMHYCDRAPYSSLAEQVKVIAHQPHSWFLLEEDGLLYLDMNCSTGPAGFIMLIRLSQEEEALARGGQASIDRLATSIQNRAISLYGERNLETEWQSKVDEAIKLWHSQAI